MTAKIAALWALLLPLSSLSAEERFACNMRGMSPAERARHRELTATLVGAVAEKVELSSGYGFRLGRNVLGAAAEWVALESKCCPFFTFELELVRHEGPLWLRLTGAPGVKTFILQELRL